MNTTRWMLVLLRRAVLLVIVLLIVDAWMIGGLFTTYRISGNSMAETLLGPHFDVTCPDCGRSFSCDAPASLRSTTVVCPACGSARGSVDGAAISPGDRILLDRTRYWRREPARWDLVVLRSPNDPRALAVKRVLGLPGETVDFHDGDLFIDGARSRKSLDEQLSVSQTVFKSQGAGPWRVASPDGWEPSSEAEDELHCWRPTKLYELPLDGDPPLDAHAKKTLDAVAVAPSLRLPGLRAYIARPVSDRGAFHQTNASRPLAGHPVRDLLIDLEVRWEANPSPDGELHVRASDGRYDYDVCITPAERRADVTSDEPNFPACRAYWKGGGPRRRVTVSLFDRRLTVALDGRTIHEVDLPEVEGAPCPAKPFELGVRSLALSVERVRVARDVYYDWNGGSPMHAPLDDGAYFVVGDNAGYSLDSRNCSPLREVRAERIIGAPLHWRIGRTAVFPFSRDDFLADIR